MRLHARCALRSHRTVTLIYAWSGRFSFSHSDKGHAAMATTRSASWVVRPRLSRISFVPVSAGRQCAHSAECPAAIAAAISSTRLGPCSFGGSAAPHVELTKRLFKIPSIFAPWFSVLETVREHIAVRKPVPAYKIVQVVGRAAEDAYCTHPPLRSAMSS